MPDPVSENVFRPTKSSRINCLTKLMVSPVILTFSQIGSALIVRNSSLHIDYYKMNVKRRRNTSDKIIYTFYGKK